MSSIYQESPGLGDIEALRLAFDTDRVLITADKDFGETGDYSLTAIRE